MGDSPPESSWLPPYGPKPTRARPAAGSLAPPTGAATPRSPLAAGSGPWPSGRPHRPLRMPSTSFGSRRTCASTTTRPSPSSPPLSAHASSSISTSPTNWARRRCTDRTWRFAMKDWSIWTGGCRVFAMPLTTGATFATISFGAPPSVTRGRRSHCSRCTDSGPSIRYCVIWNRAISNLSRGTRPCEDGAGRTACPSESSIRRG